MRPGSRISHFEVLDLVGAGGMGGVSRARDGRRGRDVAIKALSAELARDGEREVRLVNRAGLGTCGEEQRMSAAAHSSAGSRGWRRRYRVQLPTANNVPLFSV